MKTKVILGAAFVALMGAPAMAGNGMPTYPYHAANNCPAGLSPIVMGGVICCGTPNQNVSYSSMMAHPVAKKKVHKVFVTFSAVVPDYIEQGKILWSRNNDSTINFYLLCKS